VCGTNMRPIHSLAEALSYHYFCGRELVTRFAQAHHALILGSHGVVGQHIWHAAGWVHTVRVSGGVVLRSGRGDSPVEERKKWELGDSLRSGVWDCSIVRQT